MSFKIPTEVGVIIYPDCLQLLNNQTKIYLYKKNPLKGRNKHFSVRNIADHNAQF